MHYVSIMTHISKCGGICWRPATSCGSKCGGICWPLHVVRRQGSSLTEAQGFEKRGMHALKHIDDDDDDDDGDDDGDDDDDDDDDDDGDDDGG